MLGDWDRPYRTMDFGNEAGEIRALKRVIERGFVYRGLKPVYWCFDCGSSLAEFEIEYADKTSPTVDVAFECAEPDRLAAAFDLPSLAKVAYAVIWTTTPWTIPANQALNLNPALEYSLVDTERGLLLVASALVERCLKRWGLEGSVLAATEGAALDGIRFRHPLYDRLAPVYLADYATADEGTGIVHSAPGLRRGRLRLVHRARHDARRHPEPGAGQRRVRGLAAALRRHEHLEGERRHHRCAARCASAARHRQAAAQLPALLAPPHAGDLSRGGAVVRAHGRGRGRVRGRQGAAHACARRRWRR